MMLRRCELRRALEMTVVTKVQVQVRRRSCRMRNGNGKVARAGRRGDRPRKVALRLNLKIQAKDLVPLPRCYTRLFMCRHSRPS